MGNTLKMDKFKALNGLYEAGWKDRKINRATGINRRTISKYRIKWKHEKRSEAGVEDHNDHNVKQVKEAKQLIQNAPPGGGNKCPPGKVVYFEVPPGPPGQASKSQVYIFDKQITVCGSPAADTYGQKFRKEKSAMIGKTGKDTPELRQSGETAGYTIVDNPKSPFTVFS